MAKALKHLENPLPHLREAQKSAFRIVEIEKLLLGHRAELVAIHQIKKLGLAIGGIVFAVMALLFGFGWISIALNQSGWSAGAIALTSFVLFSSIAALFAHIFLRSLELPEAPVSPELKEEHHQ